MRTVTQNLIVTFLSLTSPLLAQDADGVAFFESKIRPVLIEHCYNCHGADASEMKGGLRVDSAPGLLKGGESGTALVAGKPGESLLIEALKYESYEMPPAGKLPDHVIRDFEKWIQMGAPDPRSEEPKATNQKTEEIDFDKAREFWAFQPMESRSLPKVIDAEWAKSWIDLFTLSKLEEANIAPNPDAELEVLVRRLAYDLTGLPPTPKQVLDVLGGKPLEDYVDELLSSPHFGEQWGRHWLDVARYADSNGGDFNATFHNAWRYRNYIVDSFNQDRPFQELIVEQIAGDLLDSQSDEERTRNLVATGFLMMGTKMLSERDKAKLEMDVVDEQVSTIGSAFLGMTLGCARCHDHKFDPIPTRDYYALAGILKSTQTIDGEFQKYVSNWTRQELPIKPEHAARLKEYETQERILKADLREAEAALKNLESNSERSRILSQGVVIDNTQAKLVGNWKESTFSKDYVGAGYIHDDKMDLGKKKVIFSTSLPTSGEYELRIAYPGSNGRANNVPIKIKHADGEEVIQLDQTKVASIDRLLEPIGRFQFSKDQPAEVTISNDDTNGYVIVDAVQFVAVEDLQSEVAAQPKRNEAALEVAKKQVDAIKKKMDELKKNKPAPAPLALAVREAPQQGDCNICIRGEHKNLGDKVPRGFLTVAMYDEAPSIPSESSGRLELARWIADAQNPLTARVYVNRVWQHMFGQGIVRSVDNFGSLGQKPTHPELLDQLAVEFVNHNWSTKWLVRELVLSHTYQLSSHNVQKSWDQDPENKLLWRMNRKRLTAEAIRDSVLSATNELDRSQGEAPVDDLGTLVTQNRADDEGYQQAKTTQRTLYSPVIRNELPSLMRVFDFADPDFVSGRRPETTVPAQALWLLNGPFLNEKAKQVADRVLKEQSQFPERLEFLYLLSLGRPPLEYEQTFAEEFFGDQTNEPASWVDFTHALFASSAFRMLD